MSLYLVGMADRRLTMWQEKWMLIEDESGDQVGEYLRKTNQENAICDWCNVTAKIAKYAHLGRKNHQCGKVARIYTSLLVYTSI